MLSMQFVILVTVLQVVPLWSQFRGHRFPLQLKDLRHPMLAITKKLMQTRPQKEICFDTVGCFELPPSTSPLRKAPEDPTTIATKFYLYRRNINISTPEVLKYGDDKATLRLSKFNVTQPLKIIVHGYMSKWDAPGAMAGVKAYLEIGDFNVILVDWEKGARGPIYGTAAANTEVVGRQLGLLLLDMISAGLEPQSIHLVGFSLGAHIAGCASHLLKGNGLLIGRITGLDPASPFFKFQDKEKKLDVSDAGYVDVVHTDGSPIFTDGFGLLEPIGHADYFPNGGREQPGCHDGRASVVVSQLDKGLNRDIACSHIRAWELFLESLLGKTSKENACEFTAYKCSNGLKGFLSGDCFPQAVKKSNAETMGKLGEDSAGNGAMYLVTRSQKPYCGNQLMATIHISWRTPPSRGLLHVNLVHGNYSTNFEIKCDILDTIRSGREMRGMAASDYRSKNSQTPSMTAHLHYQNLRLSEDNQIAPFAAPLLIDKITIKDMYGNSWEYCGKNTVLEERMGNQFNIVSLPLKLGKC